MMKLLGLLFFVAAAVIIGLLIAYWYLRRVEDERRRLHREPQALPMPEKHPPVDLTPDAKSVDVLLGRTDAAAAANEAEKPMEHRDAIEAVRHPTTDVVSARDATLVLGADSGAERDDLKRISGIGPKLERLLNANGIFRFRQIADWQDAEIERVDQLLPAFHGRIKREDWVGQARRLSDAAADGRPVS